jgi:hypothetical protein
MKRGVSFICCINILSIRDFETGRLHETTGRKLFHFRLALWLNLTAMPTKGKANCYAEQIIIIVLLLEPGLK